MKKLKVLSFPGKGSVIPYALAEIQELLICLDVELYVIPFEDESIFDLEGYILEQIMQFKPDIILTIDLAGLILPLFFLFPQIKIVSWFFDNPKQFFHLEDIRLKFPNYFLFSLDKQFCETVKGSHIYYLPWGAQTKVFFPQAREKKYDVSFIGHYNQERENLFKELSSVVTVNIWGDLAWQEHASKTLRYHGAANHRSDAPRIYNESKIVIALNAAQFDNGISERLYNIMACGSLALTNWMPVLFEHFVIGKELVVFKQLADLKEKVQVYLRDDLGRETIARAGALKVNSQFTLKQQLKKLLSTLALSVIDEQVFLRTKNGLVLHNKEACLTAYKKALLLAQKHKAYEWEAYYLQQLSGEALF